jgi:hypothetical protein
MERAALGLGMYYSGMHISFALFADGANISQEGKLNILGVFDALQVVAMPAVHPRATLVVRLKGTPADAGTHRVTLRWLNPNGTELWSSMGELEVVPPPVPSSDLDFPLIASIDLPLDTAGAYTMQIALDDETQANLPLLVRAPAAQPVMPMSGLVS